MSNLRLPFDDEPDSRRVADRRARSRRPRARAVDPRFNVALEASAGTGKTRVLVDRYVNLLRAGVDPVEHPGDHVHAQGGRRDARAHPRDAARARPSAARSRAGALARAARPHRRHRHQHDRRVLPVAAARVSARGRPRSRVLDGRRHRGAAARSTNRSIARCASAARVAREDEHVALVFAQLGDRRARAGLAALLNRRIVAPRGARSRYLAEGPARSDVAVAAPRAAPRRCSTCSRRCAAASTGSSRPVRPSRAFLLLARELQRLAATLDAAATPLDPAAVQAAFARVARALPDAGRRAAQPARRTRKAAVRVRGGLAGASRPRRRPCAGAIREACARLTGAT